MTFLKLSVKLDFNERIIMKTLEDLKRPIFDSIKQNNLKDFDIAFNEFDSTLQALNPEKLGREYLQPWYQVYAQLYEDIIPNHRVDYYKVLLKSRTSPVNMPDKIPPQVLLNSITQTFQYLVGHFNEQMLLAYIAHLRSLENQYPLQKHSLSLIPVSQLVMSEVSLDFLSDVFFQCQYQPDTLIYHFFIPQEEMGKDFFFNHQDRLALLLHYCEEKIRPGFVKTLAHTALKELNPFLYVALLNYLNSTGVSVLTPNLLQEEMKKDFKDNEKVNEILQGIRVE